MTIKYVILDANLLISAYDESSDRTPEIRQEAYGLIDSLEIDKNVRFAITPIIRYEVLCGINNTDEYQKVKEILDSMKLFPFDIEESNKSIEVYKSKVEELKDNQPNRYKFDILHIGTALSNNIDIESNDKKLINTLNKLKVKNNLYKTLK